MLDDDGLPLDEVGPWAKDKHELLRKYVDISRAVRRKFVQGGGGATYIDLYCGRGRAVIRDTNERIDGSPLVAFKCARERGVGFRSFTSRTQMKKNVAMQSAELSTRGEYQLLKLERPNKRRAKSRSC